MALLGILFDLDGTLVDSLPDLVGVVNGVRRRYDLPPLEAEVVRSYVGNGVEYLMEGCLKEVADKVGMLELVGEYRHTYRLFPQCGRLFPGVHETLTRLRSLPNVRLGVATNRLTELAQKTLEHYLPDVRFDAVAGPDSVSQQKPNPEHLLEVMEKLELTPAQSWFIGDHEVDAECARRAGVRFLGATYGMSGVQVSEDEKLDNFSDLLKVLPLS